MKNFDAPTLPAFARFAAAAATGLSLMGCPEKQAEEEASAAKDASQTVAKDGADKECCFGKNDCKGKGGCKTADNDCAGKNDCKAKGGCNMHCPE